MPSDLTQWVTRVAHAEPRKPKVPVHLRLDADTVSFFKAFGDDGYQTRISTALTELVRMTREGGPEAASVYRVRAIADEASRKVDRTMRVAEAVGVPAAISLISEAAATFLAELLAVMAEVPDALTPAVESALQQLVGIVRSLALARDQLFTTPSPS